MPTQTTNFSLDKPLVNNATDQDLWGGYLNSGLDTIDSVMGKECWSIPLFGEVAEQDYIFALNIRYPGTITKVTTKCTSGTCTATVKVNSTALGGTANSVSSSEEEQNHASSNTFVAGDDLKVTISSSSSATDVIIMVWATRTGAGS